MGSIERLDKVLANMGLGSRKDVKKMIKSGMVEIEGVVAKRPEIKVNPQIQTIRVNGKSIDYKKYIYLMLNKPNGVITATEDKRHNTVLDIIGDKYIKYNIRPVGRLDKDTEGLLLLTNDGKMNHNLTSPKKNIVKEYYAEINGRVRKTDIEQFNEGIVLDDGYKSLPAELVILKESDISKVIVRIKEGKYHQVKRMFQAVHKKVLYLKRIGMANLKLDDKLMPGEYRELTEEEVECLRSLI